MAYQAPSKSPCKACGGNGQAKSPARGKGFKCSSCRGTGEAARKGKPTDLPGTSAEQALLHIGQHIATLTQDRDTAQAQVKGLEERVAGLEEQIEGQDDMADIVSERDELAARCDQLEALLELRGLSGMALAMALEAADPQTAIRAMQPIARNVLHLVRQ